jgi:nucleoside-diphosphate-sugar epimerase
MVKLICGCGYLGERVARRWLAAGNEVWGLTRSNDRAATLAALGIKPIVADLVESIRLPSDVSRVTTVLFAVGFDKSPGRSMQEVYAGGVRNILGTLPDSLDRFIYISSTGVYGANQSEELDERSACRPTRAGGEASLAAEEVLASHPLGAKRIVLRLAGIYGPGRLPKMADVLAGTPIDADSDSLLNLIHVDDAVDVVLAADRTATPPALYVVSDNHPVRRGEFYIEMARRIQAPQPTFAPQQASRRQGSDRRVRSERVWRDLGLVPRYKTYQQGLAQILEQRNDRD